MSRINREHVMIAILFINTDIEPVKNGETGSVNAQAVLLGRGRVSTSLAVNKPGTFFEASQRVNRQCVDKVVEYFQAIEAKSEEHPDRKHLGFVEVMKQVALAEARDASKS